mgnify:CR=1 FL=1|tara:strand:- start:685 stop:939 length:255 start_codon:yes stop_codon:yes gene_type:complete
MRAKEKVTIDGYAKKISDRGFSVPAIFFLEMFKYLSFIFGQSLIVFGPMATIFVDQKKYYNFSDLVSKRSNIERLICQIESNSK